MTPRVTAILIWLLAPVTGGLLPLGLVVATREQGGRLHLHAVCALMVSTVAIGAFATVFFVQLLPSAYARTVGTAELLVIGGVLASYAAASLVGAAWAWRDSQLTVAS